MEDTERPTRARSRDWLLVACIAPLPILAALVLDAGGTVVVVTAILSGLIALVAALVWAIQRARRQRRDYEERLTAWSAERAVAEERLRIARDLHDISSHGIGIITVRAAATTYIEGANGDAERVKALHDIERIGRTTMTELRRMLTVLRTPGDHPAPLRPADTLETLPTILTEAERGGLIIRFRQEGLDRQDAEISPSAQLAICAIVREALANVTRHAGPTTVSVTLEQKNNEVSVLVDDDGPNPGWRPQPGAGHGLAGLRERVRAHNGTLAVSPKRNGFRLHATFPVGADT